MIYGRKALTLMTLAVILATFFGLLGWGLSNQTPVTGRSGITRIGKVVPIFRMTTFDGHTVDLAEEIGRPIIINFWASWCVPCRREAATLEAAWQRLLQTDVLFIGVGTDDVEDDARAFIQAFGVTYPSGLDLDGEITVDFGVVGLPVTFFVNRNGIVDRRWVGEISNTELNIWLDDLLTDKSPTDAFGENLDSFFEIGQDVED